MGPNVREHSKRGGGISFKTVLGPAVQGNGLGPGCPRQRFGRWGLRCHRVTGSHSRPSPPAAPSSCRGSGSVSNQRGHTWHCPDPPPPAQSRHRDYEGMPRTEREGGVGTRPWWLALLPCGGAYWPLALGPSAMTSRHPDYCGHPHCRGHPPAWGGTPWRPPLMA